MGEAKRRKKLDPSWGKNKLIKYIKAQTQEKGRGIVLFFDSTCQYMAKEEFITKFVAPASASNKEGFDKAVNFIDNYNLEREVVSLAAVSNGKEINLFCEDLENLASIGSMLQNQLIFL